MTGPKYIFDASSIVKALKGARLVPLGGQAIQWLTIYEELNAIWREALLLGRLSPNEASSLASIFKDLVGWERLYSSLRALKERSSSWRCQRG